MIDQIKSQIGKYRIIRHTAEFDLQPTPTVVLDIETAGHENHPGDTPSCANHGIAGIAIGNMNGDALYFAVNDSRDYQADPVRSVTGFLNKMFLLRVTTVLMHYSKFDLGFLVSRGLDLSKVRIVDTWAKQNILSGGIYSANKLKDLVRQQLGINTETEKDKDDWMTQHNTKDYGDVPVEIMGRYACDDTRYTLLAMLTQPDLTQQGWENHDRYVRNNLYLNAAEYRGIAVNVPLLKGRLATAAQRIDKYRAETLAQLGAAAAGVNPDDEQAFLGYLHEKALHPPPRDQYGETKFVYDQEFIDATDHPLLHAYKEYHEWRDFRTCFSGNFGEMGARLWQDPLADDNNPVAGFHPSFLPSIFSQGGLVKCKAPDITDRVHLDNHVRELFIPRPNHRFVILRAMNLPAHLLAFYTQDVELSQKIAENRNPVTVLSIRTKMKDLPTSIFLRKALEGSGFERLGNRLKAAEVKVPPKKGLYAMQDTFDAAIPLFKSTSEQLQAALRDSGSIQDRMGRTILHSPKAEYRALAQLIQSSTGSLLAFYLDLFCRVANSTGAHLVMAHGPEFVFEVPLDNEEFHRTVEALLQRPLTNPQPCWLVHGGLLNETPAGRDAQRWYSLQVEAHLFAVRPL